MTFPTWILMTYQRLNQKLSHLGKVDLVSLTPNQISIFLEKNSLKNMLQLIPCTIFLRTFSCITSLTSSLRDEQGLKHRRRKPHERKDSPQRGVSILPATWLSIRSGLWGKRFSLDTKDLSYIPVQCRPHPTLPHSQGPRCACPNLSGSEAH